MNKAIINGKAVELKSRGQEVVLIYSDKFKRTVYEVVGEWRFFVKLYGEYIEVYHKDCYFSTDK